MLRPERLRSALVLSLRWERLELSLGQVLLGSAQQQPKQAPAVPPPAAALVQQQWAA